MTSSEQHFQNLRKVSSQNLVKIMQSKVHQNRSNNVHKKVVTYTHAQTKQRDAICLNSSNRIYTSCFPSLVHCLSQPTLLVLIDTLCDSAIVLDIINTFLPDSREIIIAYEFVADSQTTQKTCISFEDINLHNKK